MKFTPKRLILVAVLFLGALLLTVLYFVQQNAPDAKNRAGWYGALPAADLTATSGITNDFRVNADFRSNLPVLTLLYEGKLKEGTPVTISVYRDSPFGEPEETVPMLVKQVKGEENKPDYVLVPAEEKQTSLLGMPAGSSFRLYAEASDPSLVRSYIGLRTAMEVTGYAPRSAFCELLTLDVAGFRYEGIYRLAETVTADDSRIKITHNRAGTEKDGYLLRRGPEQENAQPVQTWAVSSGKATTPLWTHSPLEPDADALSYMTTNFSSAERVICGEDRGTFDNVMEVNSFIDYYLINEYFGNRDAGTNVYYEVDWQGRIRMGPSENFEHAMNSPVQPENSRNLVLADSDLFRDLLKDGTFLRKMQGRYVELRQNVLKEETVYRRINETMAYLAAARIRNDARWGKETRKLNGGESGETLDLYRMKTYLSEHGKSISEHLADRIEVDRAANEGKGGNTVFFVLSFLLFLIPCILVNRRG